MKNYYENIEAYLTEALGPDERTDFEQALQKDPELQAATENHDIARLILGGLEEQDIREHISTLRQKPKSNRKRMWRRIAAAAAVLLIAVLFPWETLYEDPVLKHVDWEVAVHRSGQDADLDKLIQAIHLFDQNKIEEAWELASTSNHDMKEIIQAKMLIKQGSYQSALETIENSNRNESGIGFFLRGICNIKLSNWEEAISNLNEAQGMGFQEQSAELIQYIHKNRER